jgi:hypothetical protein
MVSVAQEEFSDTHRNLFDQVLSNGSKQGLRLGKHLEQATPFFVGRPTGDSTHLVGADKDSTSRPFAHSVPEGPCSTGETGTEAVAHFQDLQIPRLTSRSTNKEIQTRLFTQRCVFRTFSGQTGRLKFFTPAWEMITQDPWTLQVIQGYQRELVTPPVQQSLPNVPKLSSTQETVLEQEVK